MRRFDPLPAGIAFVMVPLIVLAQVPTGGPNDFDFEFGSWKSHIERLVEPLSGAGRWMQLTGSSVVRPLWGGRANLGELAVANADARIEGLSLRLYNPETRQWSIYWASSRDGELTTPLRGGFSGGRGEFYGKESFKGKPIETRFIFSHITPTSFRLEQAFSADGGKTWETNWIATFTR